jgi:hypothetical protein
LDFHDNHVHLWSTSERFIGWQSCARIGCDSAIFGLLSSANK